VTGLRLTAQARLTLAYGALFVLSGAVLTVLTITLTFWPASPITLRSDDQPPQSKPIVLPAAKDRSEVITAFEAKQQARRELRTRLVTVSGLALGVMALGAGAVGWMMAGRALRPVRTVSATARRLSQRTLHERIPAEGPRDEMRELAETFNDMLARLEQAFEAQRHFAANAAHELRAPMTAQRTLVDVAAATPGASADVHELADALRGQLNRQERLVDGLLTLAASEHGTVETAPVRVDALARDHLSDLQPQITRRSLTTHEALEPMTVTGDPVLLDLLVGNLVRNAVQHNVAGGDVWVTTQTNQLTVENTGADVSPTRLTELVEPFRRGRRDRVPGAAGAGLGLAIANAVTHAHDATLAIAPRHGGGLHATVHFHTPPCDPGVPQRSSRPP
jgi:signal transduction histidine kinase